MPVIKTQDIFGVGQVVYSPDTRPQPNLLGGYSISLLNTYQVDSDATWLLRNYITDSIGVSGDLEA